MIERSATAVTDVGSIAVLFPAVRFLLGWEKVPDLKTTGLTFATLAGAAGAFGALGVIFATAAAEPEDRIYIAPLIFGLAPVINTVVSSLWHPDDEKVFHFDPPGWKLWVGIVLIGIGAGLVLFSKEEVEAAKHGARKSKPATLASAEPRP